MSNTKDLEASKFVLLPDGSTAIRGFIVDEDCLGPAGGNTRDNEQNKFKKLPSGETVVQICNLNPFDSNTMKDFPCNTNVIVGDIVSIVSGQAEKALADSYSLSRVVGIVINKSETDTCDIRTVGVIEGGILGTLDPTKNYYLSDTVAGTMVTTPTSISGRYVVKLGLPLDADNFVLRIERIAKRA